MVLPPELARRYVITPGDTIRVGDEASKLHMLLPSHLARLYVEPTNQCNLQCRTCIRNVWDEPMGKMSEAVFARLIEGLRTFSPPPAVTFGGFGEPLSHPNIVDMIREAKALGAAVELITNGTLLTRDISWELVKLRLDVLWVSIDGATPDSYADIRLGASLPRVLENLAHLREALYQTCSNPIPIFATELGIVFVAMKRNIADLPAVMDIGRRAGAKRFLVTNVLPYTREMVDEVLYYRALNDSGYAHLSLPRMDMDETTCAPLYRAMRNVYGNWAGINPRNARNRCPFIENGAGAVSWDGGLSPCLPLLHSHTSHLGHLRYDQHFSRRWAIGNLMEHGLSDLWYAPEHVAFRERVQAFDFPPCAICGSCHMSASNEEDCYGNEFPTCGGCLWAQGVIQCP